MQKANLSDFQSLLHYDESLDWQQENTDDGKGNNTGGDKGESDSNGDANDFVQVGVPIIIVLVVVATLLGIFFKFCVEKKIKANGKRGFVIKS